MIYYHFSHNYVTIITIFDIIHHNFSIIPYIFLLSFLCDDPHNTYCYLVIFTFDHDVTYHCLHALSFIATIMSIFLCNRCWAQLLDQFVLTLVVGQLLKHFIAMFHHLHHYVRHYPNHPHVIL